MVDNFNGAPYVMALREYICKKSMKIGLFIPEKCIEASGWIRKCDPTACTIAECSHYKGLEKFITLTKQVEQIHGFTINEPRMLILAATGALKIENGVNKGSATNEDYNIYKVDKKLFNFVNRFKLLFLDENKKPLHTNHIQYSVKGATVVELLKQLGLWRTAINKACSKNKRLDARDNKYLWIFYPELAIKNVGKQGAMSPVCYVKDFHFDTDTAFENYYVGDTEETFNLATELRTQCKQWVKNCKLGISTRENVLDDFGFSDDDDENNETSPSSSSKRLSPNMENVLVDYKRPKIVDF
ncbi:hypothetical protein [Trichoplusia ni ascovirus 2c]|uniref:hypothetical protein n=1 Tax=Trichoplusia ni ascovirus 2c TaxID=328615 RepID=UPI0000E44256|nr:hypothetical protein TNAV2c_gp126 [Trichoplusia ni ascovirus 2c]ABF70643.1 hypothetical protein [Trichoplusia ni ascovirus 2c]